MKRLINWLLPVGRRSLLWGVHQFLWHPVTVWLAWRRLYGQTPNWRECVCIVIHDWGYWFSPNMDGPEGERHPELGARIAGWLLGPAYADLVLLHSRHYARLAGKEPSRLCWADKLSMVYDPWWFYLPRGWLSREIVEYRQIALSRDNIPRGSSYRQWYGYVRKCMTKLAAERRGDAVDYHSSPVAGGKAS